MSKESNAALPQSPTHCILRPSWSSTAPNNRNKGTLIRSACHQLHCWNTLGTGAHYNFLLGTLATLEWMQNSWLHSQHKAKETLAMVRTYPPARLAWLRRDESPLVRRRPYKEPFNECSTGKTHEHLTAWPQQFSQQGWQQGFGPIEQHVLFFCGFKVPHEVLQSSRVTILG